MVDERRDLIQIIDLLVENFGLRPRLTWEEIREMENHFHFQRYASCIDLIAERFVLREVRVNVILLSPRSLEDHLRFTWLDRWYSLWRELSGIPPRMNFPNPMSCDHLRPLHGAQTETHEVDLKIRSWAKRLPFETFVLFVARHMAWISLNQSRLFHVFQRYAANAEVLAIITGFDYFIASGRISGRYDFGLLGWGDLVLVNNMIDQKRMTADIQ